MGSVTAHVDQFMKECIFSVYYFKLASVLIYQKISVHKMVFFVVVSVVCNLIGRVH